MTLYCANGEIISGSPSPQRAANDWFGLVQRAGWRIKESGNGSSLYTSSGSNLMGATAGYIRVQDPGGGREFVFQSFAGPSGATWYSPRAHFSGGTAGSRPTASDEILLESRSLYNDGSSWRQYGIADSAPPYGFWHTIVTRTGLGEWVFFMDPVVQSHVADADPVVIAIAGSNFAARPGFAGNQIACLITSSFIVTASGLVVGGNYNGVWRQVAGAAYAIDAQAGGLHGTSTVDGQRLGPNPFNGALDSMPIVYLADTLALGDGICGVKGMSSYLKWTGTPRQSFVDTADSYAWLCIDDVWLRWAGVPPQPLT